MKLKSFSQNTLYYAIGIIIIRFTTFLLIPLYTEFLSKEDYGLLATLLFTTEIIITINDVGMRSAFMRFFSEYQSSNKLNDLIGSSTFINIVVGILLLGISFFIPASYLSKLFQVEVLENVIILTILVGIFRTLSLNILSYFRAKNQGVNYMIISIVSSVLLIISTWIVLKYFDWGINGVLFAQIFTYGLSWLFVLVWIIIKDGLKITSHTSKLLFKFGYPLILATSGTMLVNTSGNYFLGAFRSLENVAVLAVAYKVASIGIMVLIAPFQLAYEPYVFNNKNNPELKNIISKIITFISLAYLLVGILILYVFKYLMNIIGNGGYSDAYVLVIFLLPGLGFTALNYIGQSQIHLKNKTKTTGFISFIVTIISIIITYFSTKFYGSFGTAFGINTYLIISGFALFYYGNKEFRISVDLKRINIILIVGLLVLTAFYFLSFQSYLVFYTISSILIVVVLFGFLFSKFLLNNEKELLLNGFNKILKSVKLR